MIIMSNIIEDNYKYLLDLLKYKNKATTKDGALTYYEDFNDPNNGSHSSANTKRTKVVYLYTNPQFNRMMAKLEDGRTVDYNLSFMQIYWNRFVEYNPPKPESKKMTIDEISKELGYDVEIV